MKQQSVFSSFLVISVASLSNFLKRLFKRQYATLMWPLVGWFTDYFCLNSLIPTFVLFVSAIASPMGTIIFVLKATTMQWECCVFHTRGIPFFLFSCFWFCTPFFFSEKHPHLSEGIFNTAYSLEKIEF